MPETTELATGAISTPGALESDGTVTAANLVETHSGVVFFVGQYAYKLKKPVSFGFLDFSRREAREAACYREVALNRRLSPDVYLGVADVRGPDGAPCDHLVVMKRLPWERRLATLAVGGASLDDDIRRLAHLLAAFHSTASSSAAIDAAAGRDAQTARWNTNTGEMRRFVGSLLDASLVERVDDLAGRYLAGRGPLFAGRVAEGRARDGHGDLLADDIFCLADGPRVLDCLEFDDALRWGDTLADVAFLAMDLERLGRPDLAAKFLLLYREFAGDTWPQSLADHYIAYRAQVRAKVACLRSEQGDDASAVAAHDLLAQSVAHLEAGRVRLVVVGGLPGTGKSTLAAGIADALDAVLLRSDVVRKQLAGLDPTTPAGEPFRAGLYRPEVTAATYTALLDRARTALSHGESVVLDATWHDASWRDAAAKLAVETFSDLAELRCVVPRAVAEGRLAARAASGSDASDATGAIASELASAETPWPTALSIDTTPDIGAVLDHVLERLGVVGDQEVGSVGAVTALPA